METNQRMGTPTSTLKPQPKKKPKRTQIVRSYSLRGKTMSETKKDEKKHHLNSTLSFTKENGITLTISSMCGDWESMQKFLNDFEDTLLKGKNGKSQHQTET
jgi:hypothetical protein